MRRRALKVFWEKCGPGEANFGDRLTPLLLGYAGLACEWAPPSQADLIGIGSILESVPQGYRGAVWTSGRMHERTRADLTASNVIALRGALTRAGVELAPAAAPRLGDGGLLVSMFARKRPKRFKLGIVPHYFHARSAVVARVVASSPEIALIDICSEPQEIVELIGRCEAIVSSSLHGLITADALEVPNAWIEIGGETEVGGGGFKYLDYYSAFDDLRPAPHRLSPSDTLDTLLPLTGNGRRPGLDRVRAGVMSALSDVAQLAHGASIDLGRVLSPLCTSASERERDFVARLDSPYFTGADDIPSGAVALAQCGLEHAPIERLAAFFSHCLALLGQLRAALIGHNDLCGRTVHVLDGLPLVTDFGWAQRADSPADLHADVVALARLFAQINRGRYAPFDDAIALMAHPDPALRLTDLEALRQVFEHAADVRTHTAVAALLQQVRARDARLEEGLRRKWGDDAYLAKLEILGLLQPGGRVIAVDHEATLSPTFDAPPFVPFIEKDGQYFGPPPDDATAIAELERMRGTGAQYIAFTWPAFWWLDYYVGFARYLEQNFEVALANERLRVFDLKPHATAASARGRGAARPAKLDASGRVALDLPLELLQAVRLAHALMETRFEIQIAPRDEAKFARLREVFGVRYGDSPQTAPLLRAAEVRHERPSTRVGAIERALIFPHAMLQRCRGRWVDDRTVAYSFAGLMTDRRQRVLAPWLGGAATSEDRATVVQPSTRGRSFPGKSWDEDYFDLLCRSRFVLCPNGDHVWTYRFFESIICGAIPVVEDECPHYAGFVYATLAEPQAATWSRDAVLHNYDLCRARTTVDLEALESEIRACIG